MTYVGAIYQRADKMCSSCMDVKGPLMEIGDDDMYYDGGFYGASQMFCSKCLRQAADELDFAGTLKGREDE